MLTPLGVYLDDAHRLHYHSLWFERGMARAYNSDQCCTTCLLPSNEFHHAGIYHHQCHAKSVVRDASSSVALWRHLHAGFSVCLQPCHFGSALSKVVGKSLALYTVSVTHSRKRGSRWDVYGALHARLYLLSCELTSHHRHHWALTTGSWKASIPLFRFTL